MKADFAKVFAEALRKRLYPNTALHVSQLAYAIGCSGETLKNAMRGQHSTSSHYVASCIDYFARCGDVGFLCELYPNAVTPLVQRQKRAEKAIAFAESFQAFVQQGAAA